MKRSVTALMLAAALSFSVLPWISAHSAGTVHETVTTETDFGGINNLVSNTQQVNGQQKSVSSDGVLVSGSAGTAQGTLYVDGGDRAMYFLGDCTNRLDSTASLTVRYDFIGYYYPGRVYVGDGTPAISIGAEVTLNNPVNATQITLFKNFWYGGVVNALSGKPGGRADYAVTFFRTDTGEVMRLGEDAQLLACSLDGWPLEPKVSYEGISFYNAQETWVNYRSDGNIGYDAGDLFGVPAYHSPVRKAAYEDIKDHKTFINCAVAFRQNDTTWRCAFVTQFSYEGTHGEWFYFAASPANLLVPVEPTKTAEEAAYHVGDTITYHISQKVALTPDEGYGSYASFQFIDRLPAGLDYVSASIACSDGTVPDSAGSIAYDAAGRVVTYTFSPEYLRTVEYSGQTYTFTVVCRINAAAMGGQAFANTAEVAINGQVSYTVASGVTPYCRITTEAVNGTIDPGFSNIGAGESRTVSYRPNAGCLLQSVTVDGTEVDPGAAQSSYTWTDIRANHHIRVVYQPVPTDRSVLVTKRIKAADIVFDHGYPTFLFRLEGVDVFGNMRTCYGAVVFTPECVAANTAADGYVSCSTVFSGLVSGTYTVTEEVTNRYALAEIAEVTGGIVSGKLVQFDLTANQQGSAVFTNQKYEQGGLSDSCLVENIIQ